MGETGLVTRREVSSSTASALAHECAAYAEARGWEVAAAVVDPRGALVAFVRTDDVVVPAIEFAIDKAYTAATLRKSTEAFFARAEGSPSLRLGLGNRPRLLVWSGGLAIFDEGTCIGGLGVSGASDAEDVECASAALRALGLTAGP